MSVLQTTDTLHTHLLALAALEHIDDIGARVLLPKGVHQIHELARSVAEILTGKQEGVSSIPSSHWQPSIRTSGEHIQSHTPPSELDFYPS